MSCVYVPAVVIVAHYFDENRAIATAIAVGGTGLFCFCEEILSKIEFLGLGNAIVAQVIYVLNRYYTDWRDTTLILSGILFTITLFGSLFRPVQFQFHRKDKNYHHTRNDTRLPPSCMTSIEKLQRFISEMDKQCAQRHAHRPVSTSSNNEHASINDDSDSISVANESDLFDSYSADDITDIQQENRPKIDIVTFREKISNDMTFLNERWKKITRKQGETGPNTKLFRMPNFRLLISKPKERTNNTLTVPSTTTDALIDKSNPSVHHHHLGHHGRDRQASVLNETKPIVLSPQITFEDNSVNKKETPIKTGE